MSTEVVESILARCLLESGFLERLKHQPMDALDAYDLPPAARRELAEAAWHKVKCFSGFVGKVQHNYLWEMFPCTRRLLVHYGIEHHLFADYRATQLTVEVSSAERPARARAFLDFAAGWIRSDSQRRRTCRPLLEVMQHERASWEVRTQPKSSRPSQSTDLSRLTWMAVQRLVIAPAGIVHVRRFAINPLQIVAALESGDVSGLAKLRTPVLLAYWRNVNSSQVRIAEIDDVSAVVMSCVDGVRSIRGVVAAARRTVNAPPRAFRPLLEAIVSLSLVVPCKEV